MTKSDKKFFQKGSTLVEALLTIFIFALAMVTMGTLIFLGYRTYAYNFQQVAAISEARRAIETMVKEIREAKYGDDGSYPISQAGDFNFIFYSDIDGVATTTERIRYFLDGTDFKKGVVKPTGDPPQYVLGNEQIAIISSYVHNDASPVFKYYNGDWPADAVNNPLPTLTRLTDTKLMHVYLVINVDPNRPPDNFILESDTQIRNLKTNL